MYSGYKKRGFTDWHPINSFFFFKRTKTFYIEFKIAFLKILNKKIKISFWSNYDYFC